ncbi:MAG: serine hydrolase [Acidobacteria bacterium]|nr:serine hydrolase [Acidobacteriota bacterium]
MKQVATFLFSIILSLISIDLDLLDFFVYKTEYDFPKPYYALLPLIPSISAPSALVAEISSGKIILARNEKEVRPIASLTKMVAALTLLYSNQDLSEELIITEDDIDSIKGSTSHIPTGTAFTRMELLNLALMSSENRASLCLARNYRGGSYFFVRDMNRLCQALNAKESYFVDPTGLSPMNVSNCLDLFHITRAAYCKEILRDFSTRDDLLFKSKNSKFQRYFGNTDKFVTDIRFNIKFSKTGYILESGRCIVLVFEAKSKDYFLALLGEKSVAHRDEDVEIIARWVNDVVEKR